MPRNADITVTTAAVQLTNADVTALRVQNRSTTPVRLMATAGAVAPSDWAGAITLAPGETLTADVTLANLFPGVSGATRVYASTEGLTTIVSVSHA